MANGDLHGGDDIPHDVPLILKASCDERVKRIRFVPNVQQLCFREFHQRIGNALQFDSVEFSVTWQDDDGEYCEITNDDDLKEALLYFLPACGSTTTGDAQPQPISMRVNVRVETAISLSDFGGSSAWGESDESDEDDWSVGDGASDGSGRIRLSGSGSTTSSTRIKSSSLGKDWSRSRRQFNSRVNSVASSSQAASADVDDLSSLRSLSLQSSPRHTRRTSSSSSGSDDSMNTRAPRVKRPVRAPRPAEEPDGFNVHHDIECNACRVKPIVGVRYHCASCVKGANFCGDCERTGNAVKRSTHHNESHIMVKLASPLRDAAMAETLHTTMQRMLQRLTSQSVATAAVVPSNSSSSSSSSSSSGLTTTREVVLVPPLGAGTATLTTTPTTMEVRCSFCTAPFTSGVRYLCANCPIVGAGTRDGYNLCATCEKHSLKIHDPAHFFLKISTFPSASSPYSNGRSPRIPLGDRWDVQEMLADGGGGTLLPCLYSGLESFDPLLPPGVIPRPSPHNTLVRTPDGLRIEEQHNGGNRLAEEEETLDDDDANSRGHWLAPWSSRTRDIRLHSLREARSRTIIPLENLVHPSILCDNCFHVIHGAWYRCVHCTSSYDLCTTCMSRIAHDPTHAFAVFKQPVDLDLFKSCVDHQDVGERQGSSRPMLPFAVT